MCSSGTGRKDREVPQDALANREKGEKKIKCPVEQKPATPLNEVSYSDIRFALEVRKKWWP